MPRLNKSQARPSNVPHPMEHRRLFLRRLSGATALVLLGTSARASAYGPAAPLAVAAPNAALAALVAAVGGQHVSVAVDAKVPTTSVRIGAEELAVANGLVLKGKGPARARFLDDARNAPRVAAQIRAALAKADPDHAADYAAQQKQWSKAFVRKVLAWQTRLGAGKWKGKQAKDGGRIYLLDWAGIVAAPGGVTIPALGQLPAGPSGPSAAAYEAYVAALVSALA